MKGGHSGTAQTHAMMKQKPNLRGIDIEDIGIIGIDIEDIGIIGIIGIENLSKARGTPLAVDAGEQQVKKWCIRLY